jgi:hypothetical protein
MAKEYKFEDENKSDPSCLLSELRLNKSSVKGVSIISAEVCNCTQSIFWKWGFYQWDGAYEDFDDNGPFVNHKYKPYPTISFDGFDSYEDAVSDCSNKVHLL